MTHGSLFSGIGGFDLAAERMGWQNIFHCEIEPSPRKVLNYYWPNAISYHDIKQTDFTVHRGAIDILTGGFPCQPYSTAGLRKGKEDDRHLWPQMLRAIREIQPRWVVGENVRGLTNWNGGMVFDEVQADLEAEGYEVTPFLLPACGVNAPHRRDRIWFVAYNNGKFDGRKGRQKVTNNNQWEAVEYEQERREVWDRHSSVSAGGATPDSDSNQRPERWMQSSEQQETERYISSCNAQIYWRIDWQNFPTQSPVCGRNDGLPDRLDGITFSKWRNESIKGYGNAVVPQVVYQIFKAIELYERRV